MLDWDDLRVFLACARTGSFKEGAARLRLDPTTVARRVQRLEDEMRTTLFVRSPRGLQLPREQESWDAGSTLVNCKVAAKLPDGSGLAPVTGSLKVAPGSVGDAPAAGPAPTNTPSDAVSRCAMRSLAILRPDGKVVISTLMARPGSARRGIG